MKSKPRAEVLDLGVKWDAGAPVPMLVAGPGSAVVLCYESLATAQDEHVIEIRFDGCASIRMGHPNDEVLHGHPLWARGLKSYEAHVVHDSPLLAEHRRINAVHDHHSESGWAGLRHFFLAFHDEVVEALARAVTARRLPGDMAAELGRAAAEMAARP